ncbi:MAG: hypothetical protein QXO94_03755 [Candidatus Bathyarchaeia archaeon]
MPFGMGPWGWFIASSAIPYCWFRCRWFPWLPRLWTGIYGPLIPYRLLPLSREEEIAMLEEEAKLLEQQLALIRKRLEDLKK